VNNKNNNNINNNNYHRFVFFFVCFFFVLFVLFLSGHCPSVRILLVFSVLKEKKTNKK